MGDLSRPLAVVQFEDGEPQGARKVRFRGTGVEVVVARVIGIIERKSWGE